MTSNKNEEVDENIYFKDYLNPPKHVFLYGQEKELIVKLNDGRKGIKKWKWYPDENLDEGGEWEEIGSPGDGSVYINQRIGSLFELQEAKITKLDKNISFQESNNSDSNDNKQIFDNDESQIQDIDDNSSVQNIEEVDENIYFKDYLNPPKNVFLYGQEKELIVKLNDGRKGIKKWKWYPDENLDEGGEWEEIGSPGDGSVYINQRIGSLFELQEAKITKLDNLQYKNIFEVDENISFQESNNSDSNDNKQIFDNDESQIQDIDDNSSVQNFEEVDEIISSQESLNSNSNDNKQIFDNDESQIQDIDDNSSIISIILFNAIKDKNRFKPSLFNEKNNIKIDDLDLTIKTFNSLRRNDIRFLHQLSQVSKNDLLRLKNLGYKSCEELISAIINFHQKFDDENNINDQFKIEIPKDNRIEKLNTNSNVLHLLKRNGIINISDLSRFTEFEIKNINGFGPICWDNLKQNLKNYEKNHSTKVNFKDGINNDGILCNDKDNDYSDEFWNFIQEKFKNIRTQTNDSDIENIDNFLELFFQEAYEKNNNLKTLEIIYLISDEAYEKFNDSSIKKSTLEYSLYKYLIFKKFLNSKTTLNALTWIRNFRNLIDRNNSVIIYLQRISGKTLAEIGRERNVSRERIRQIELKISKYIGTSASELTNICGNLKEKILFKEEYSAFLEIIKKFGRMPHKLDKFSEKNNWDYIDNFLKLNLKERIDIYEKFKFEIPASEYDFHYEYITCLNGIAGNGYWLKLENLKEFLFRHANKLGEPDLMPKQTSLPRAVGAVVTRHGGQSKVASLIGLKYQGQLVNPDGGRVYWTDERLEELIDDVNKFQIQDLSIMPEKSEFVEFFKKTTITKYHDKKVYSAFAAFTKQEVLTWEEVAKKFKRKLLY